MNEFERRPYVLLCPLLGACEMALWMFPLNRYIIHNICVFAQNPPPSVSALCSMLCVCVRCIFCNLIYIHTSFLGAGPGHAQQKPTENGGKKASVYSVYTFFFSLGNTKISSIDSSSRNSSAAVASVHMQLCAVW